MEFEASRSGSLGLRMARLRLRGSGSARSIGRPPKGPLERKLDK